MNTWRSHRNEFFSQWIKFIYDMTSFLPERAALGLTGSHRNAPT